jgi:hypothetical protein
MGSRHLLTVKLPFVIIPSGSKTNKFQMKIWGKNGHILAILTKKRPIFSIFRPIYPFSSDNGKQGLLVSSVFF